MKIVDPHHHLWDLRANYYPWLTDHVTPRVCGDYAAIRRNYLVSDFRRDIAGLDVIASVHVQAEHDPRDPVRETSWLQTIADDTTTSNGFPHGIVAYADLSAPDAESTLAAHRRFRNVRGIRQILHGVLNHPTEHKDLIHDPIWCRNLGLLQRFDLSFDLQLYPSQVPDMLPLIAANPGITFILCHTGLPRDDTFQWRSAMRALSQCKNVAVKISGFGMFDRRWTLEIVRPFIRDTIELFGPARAMLASNFPVDGMARSYGEIWESFDAITIDLTANERRALFCDTALRIYRLTDAARPDLGP